MPSGLGCRPRLVSPPEWPSWMLGDSRLVCWLREDVVLTSGAVSEWTDKSGSGNHFTQSFGTYRPTTGTGINSKPTIVFDGVDDSLTGPDFSALTAGECFLVGKNYADPGASEVDRLWKFGTSGSADHWTYNGDSNAYLGWGSSTRQSCGNPSPSLTSPWMLNCISTSSEWTARLNNSSFYSTGTNTVAFYTACVLGSDGAGTFRGDFAEYIMFNAKLSSTERGEIETYLQTRYAY